jgi:hypothetical protein
MKRLPLPLSVTQWTFGYRKDDRKWVGGLQTAFHLLTQTCQFGISVPRKRRHVEFQGGGRQAANPTRGRTRRGTCNSPPLQGRTAFMRLPHPVTSLFHKGFTGIHGSNGIP